MATKTMTRENTAGTDTYADFMKRGIRAYTKRAAAGEVDTETLAQMVALQDQMTQAMTEVVVALRADGYSWAQIAAELGITKAAAYKRYGHLDPAGARKPGAQPGHLR